ncbi:stage V sporulation protein D [Ammoniphilus sp. CFH 90114]|uniref:stage V sporulation protein D n=1 Tax=Ammoniphilus sp. CFH 90114 TaxID=2493665 RepID=UPI00100F43F3|nr:stage V sporulation protein D [Ammoniphilus sp. CFH 90114]RXT15001.1 stage V sporulation protein D [Ammoniphilus sp. CFH 90114]
MRVSNVTVRRRIFIALLIGVFLYSLLVARLGYVQVIKGPWLTKNAEELWTRNIPFEAKRGMIYDRNGEVLAYNISVPSVMAIPIQVKDKPGTAKELARVLKGNEQEIYRQITKRSSIVRVPGGRKISEETAKELRQLGLPGVHIAEDSKRYYPLGAFASHILGFTGIDNQGLAGIEKVYDDMLSGERGAIKYDATAKGEKMPGDTQKFTPPKDGLNLYLTIDANIQAIIERELDQAFAFYDPDDALVIAMDPKTGEILGMASRPNYHPELFREYPSETYNRNLPIWKTYEPGSTFKIITLAAALEEGKVDLDKERFNDPGSVNVAGARLRCWKPGGHGDQTFLQVVENSCNPGFVALGQRLGKEMLFDYIGKFGFGKKTGIDLIGEENGVMFKMSRVGPVELATTAFGQGVSVTPIQQVAAVSAAINGGKLIKPHLAKEWHHPITGDTVAKIEPEVVAQVISPETSSKVRYALESVVANGTGRNAYIDGYRVGGKTGTAQKVENGVYSKSKHIVSFIGIAPADDPQIVVYTAVDNPKGVRQFGGTIAAPIVRNILDSALRSMEVPKRKEQMPKEYMYPDKKLISVPNLIGMEKDRLQSQYYAIPLEVEGNGDVVTYQSPAPGTNIEEGKTIRIYLGR